MNQTHIQKKKKKYEINSLIYTLFFLVIYPSKSHFYKCQSNTQLFHYALFNSFYQILNFLKLHFFILYFYKKLNQTHLGVTNPEQFDNFETICMIKLSRLMFPVSSFCYWSLLHMKVYISFFVLFIFRQQIDNILDFIIQK